MTELFFFIGYCALFLGVFAFMFWLKARSRQDRAPFPDNTRLLRGPGESLRRKLAAMDEKVATDVAVSLAIPFIAVGIGLYFAKWCKDWPPLIAVTCVTILVFAALIVLQCRRLISLIDRRRNTALGYFGELAVAEALDPLKATGHRVFHDVPGDGPAGKAFNLDHVVIGPAGVFAIETKTRRKGRARTGFMAHEIIYDGRTLSYPWGEDTHGLEQARRQTEWLAAFLQQQLGRAVPVSALLVFPGWFIIRKGRGAVNVLNPRELPAAIESRNPVPALDAAAIDLISRQLEARCRDVEL